MGDSRRFPPADASARKDVSPGRAGAPGLPGDSSPAAALRHELCAAVARSLPTAWPDGARVAVALSGGRDSVVLLDAALASAAAVRCEVLVFHVDHRLSSNAPAWSQFCRELCAVRRVPFHVQAVDVERGPRISVEAAARDARYAALDALARSHGAAGVLLAHHADDQAETTLLQLLRGAGPRGLAAMPQARFAEGIWWLRPFLQFPRSKLEQYAKEQALAYVDDESNVDSRYRRNALRNTVVPALRAIAPGYPGTLTRAAELQAEAAALLDDLAGLDGRDAYDGDTLDCSVLERLGDRRASNLLRWFLREQRLPAPSRARLDDMLRQLGSAAAGARIAISHAGAELGVYRGRLVVHRAMPHPFAHPWDGTAAIVLPHGTLRLVQARGTGIAARHVAGATVTIRSGVKGERLQMAGRASRRRVADLLREAGVPRWDRLALPRIYCDQSLAAVAPLGADAAFAAGRDEPGWALEWRPAATGA